MILSELLKLKEEDGTRVLNKQGPASALRKGVCVSVSELFSSQNIKDLVGDWVLS